MRKLAPTIWQSDELEARRLCEGSREGWIKEGIKAVLCPAFNVRIPYHINLSALILPIWDNSYAPATMYELAVRFHRDFGPTLVHCHGGLNRSSAFAAALLMDGGMTMGQALNTVNRRPWDLLMASLRDWESRRRIK